MDKKNTRLMPAAFLAIALLAVFVRLYHVTYPVADWHSWRQSDTAAVARNFLKFGIHPLYPRYDDLSNIQSGKDNPQGWRMVEFPLYQAAAAYLEKIMPQLSIEVWLRLLTIAASAGTAVFVGLLVWDVVDPLAGLCAAFIFAVLPYSVYYGRTILPDPHMVFWSVFSLWLLRRGKNFWWIFFAGVAAAIALLSKPMAIFLLIPALYIFYKRFSFSKHWFIAVLVYLSIGVLPLLFWRRWILQFPEGIPVSSWLLNGNGIRFRGAWFHWLFATRLGDLILGFWGFIPFGIGVLHKNWFIRWWAAGVLLYLIVFATGNVQHDYYQILIIPVVAAYAGIGLATLIRQKYIIIAVVSVTAMLGFSWFTIRSYYWINRPEIVEAGREADKILPKDAKVIASYNGDTTFLYQINRPGWPLGFDIDKKIAMGATAYVTVSPSDADGETKDLAARYTVLVRNDRYAIIDLTKPK